MKPKILRGRVRAPTRAASASDAMSWSLIGMTLYIYHLSSTRIKRHTYHRQKLTDLSPLQTRAGFAQADHQRTSSRLPSGSTRWTFFAGPPANRWVGSSLLFVIDERLAMAPFFNLKFAPVPHPTMQSTWWAFWSSDSFSTARYKKVKGISKVHKLKIAHYKYYRPNSSPNSCSFTFDGVV